MSVPIACRICSGPLRLRFQGGASGAEPRHLSPTNHRPGEHGDLYACRDCGTVQQPALPVGRRLHDLYREVRDDAYLDEQEGRRVTARRLLDLIGRYAPAGRLVDVGCGHGLLLDEARSRGYEVAGLELSANSAAYARDVLGLDVHELALNEFQDEDGFSVIVLADVLEHLDDPAGAIEHCRGLLAPGGVLCVVTPDPASLTARLAGRRWWGYLPAHTYLVPRRTLRELLGARGLVISEDVPLVRSFSLSYWLHGLAERSDRAGRLVARLGRTALGRVPVSLSLGDERVLLAHRVEPISAPNPRVVDRGGETKVHVVLPAYNAERTIPLVAASLPSHAADRALLVDDASPDDTTPVALREGFDVLTHPANRGYGANQKTCYTRAALDGADVVVMVHADNQYDPALVADMVGPIEEGIADVVIGSRMLRDEAIAGGMPRWKWFGNRLLTFIENRGFRRGFSEYHTGYRAFSVDFLRSIAFHRNSDDFVFDQEIFAQIVAREARVMELAIPTRYFLEASSVSFRTSVAYGLRTLYVLSRFRLDERRHGWALLRPPAARPEAEEREPVGSRRRGLLSGRFSR